MDIQRLKPDIAQGFEQGDYITVQEKVDGSNFSIRYDEETDTVKSFSRKRELDALNNLRGAWEWSQKLDKNRVKEVLGNNLCLFGEWLVKHTVPYPDDKYNDAYFYDVYDLQNERYLFQDKVREIVDKLELNYVPVFFEGTFTSWDEVKQFVGQTSMGGEFGEGIVVKNWIKLNNPNTRTPFYTKIVCEQFCETKAHKESSKTTNFEAMAERQRLTEIVETVVTEARVRKLLHKMVDDGLIPENWNEYDMKTIAKNIGKETYYDCVKEEPDIVNEVGEYFGKFANSTAMKLVRQILAEKNYV